jgi:hypothetical protein
LSLSISSRQKGGAEVQFHSFLNSALEGGLQSASPGYNVGIH